VPQRLILEIKERAVGFRGVELEDELLTRVTANVKVLIAFTRQWCQFTGNVMRVAQEPARLVECDSTGQRWCG
jgi:hypothetical protein